MHQNDLEILKHVVDHCSFSSLRGEMQQYQYVVTGLQADPRVERRIGYVIQIRKKAAYMSKGDLVFLRHPDGELVVHENQSYHLIKYEHLKLIIPLFKIKPEDEDDTKAYKYCDKIPEIGFIIERSSCVAPW